MFSFEVRKAGQRQVIGRVFAVNSQKAKKLASQTYGLREAQIHVVQKR